MPVKPVPEGYGTLTPYLIAKNAARAIDFYTRAFGAKELYRLPGPDGTVGHAELQVGDSRFMLADESPDRGAVAPKGEQGHSVSFLVYVADVDAAFKRAIDAGATKIRAVENQFYGDRAGTLQDPFGHMWTLATHVEDVSPDEMRRRVERMAASQG
jgi:PhnB protein